MRSVSPLRLALGVVVAALVTALSTLAGAQATEHVSSVEGTRIGVAVGGGYVIDRRTAAGNPLGLGLGIELGHTFPSGMYLGGAFQSFPRRTAGQDSLTSVELTIELGVDFRVGDSVVLRPCAGLGATRYDGSSGSSFESRFRLFFDPGVVALIDVSEHVYVGGSLRFGFAWMDGDGAGRHDVDASVRFAGHLGARF